jgi:hypothetical protein
LFSHRRDDLTWKGIVEVLLAPEHDRDAEHRLILATEAVPKRVPMSHATQQQFLEAEKATLARLVAELGEDEILERIGLESRLQEVTIELTSLHSTPARAAEAELVLPGVFMGVLHASRTFEHQLDSGEIIRGGVEPTLDLTTLIDLHLQPCTAHVRVLHWTGDGREDKRYTLRRVERPLPTP